MSTPMHAYLLVVVGKRQARQPHMPQWRCPLLSAFFAVGRAGQFSQKVLPHACKDMRLFPLLLPVVGAPGCCGQRAGNCTRQSSM